MLQHVSGKQEQKKLHNYKICLEVKTFYLAQSQDPYYNLGCRNINNVPPEPSTAYMSSSRSSKCDDGKVLHIATCGAVLLMVQKSGVHQLRLVVYPIIYKASKTSQVVSRIFSINSRIHGFVKLLSACTKEVVQPVITDTRIGYTLGKVKIVGPKPYLGMCYGKSPCLCSV